MDSVFNIGEFNITELETIEAPQSDFQRGVVDGVITGLIILDAGLVIACVAVAAC